MQIRKAVFEDIEQIMRIYQIAKTYMIKSGNENQWIDGYPRRQLIEKDIELGHCFVIYEKGEPQQLFGVFAFILGEDPTYRYIEDGRWLNKEPYGAIHRVGSDGRKKGIFDCALAFCRQQIANIRIDTHRDNLTMQHLIETRGFHKCGTIYVEDGSPRIAYHYERKDFDRKAEDNR